MFKLYSVFISVLVLFLSAHAERLKTPSCRFLFSQTRSLYSDHPIFNRIDGGINKEDGSKDVSLSFFRKKIVEFTNEGGDLTFGKTIIAEELPEFQTVKFMDHSAVVPLQMKRKTLNELTDSKRNPSLLKTKLQQLESGFIQKNFDGLMLVLHGAGSSQSHSYTMRSILRHFSAQTGKEKSTIAELKEYPSYKRIYAEAIDLPEHQAGAPRSFVENAFLRDSNWPQTELESMGHYLAGYIQQLKAKAPQLPFYMITRSSSAILALEVHRLYPDLMSGAVLISPTLPGNEKLLQSGAHNFRTLVQKGDFFENHHGFLWMEKLLRQTLWDEPHIDKYFPVLILTGENDTQVAQEERAHFSWLSRNFPNVKYIDLPKAEHDVLNTDKNPHKNIDFRETGLNAYRTIFDFIAEYRY